MRKVLEFMGSPEMLIALLYSDDVCQTIKNQVMSSGKVSMFVFAEDEPCYAPDSDDIQITKTGEDVRPQYTVDDLRYGEKVENLDTQFDGADEMMGQNITLAGGYRTHEPFGMRLAVHFRPDLTNEEIAMLEGRGDDSEVVGT